MRRFLILICLLALACCNTPGPYFAGVPVQRITIAGSVFDVRLRGLQAQAIRINPQYAPRFGPIRARAALAMQQASGCRVVSISGDQALATGLLDCGDGPLRVLRAPVDLDCVPVRGSGIEEIGQVRVEMDCVSG